MSRDVRPQGLASVSRPILLASALVSGCLALVMVLASIIWPLPQVERSLGQDLFFERDIFAHYFGLGLGPRPWSWPRLGLTPWPRPWPQEAWPR